MFPRGARRLLYPLCVVFAFAAVLWMKNTPKTVHPVLGRYTSLQGPAYVASAVGVAIVLATLTKTGAAETIGISLATVLCVLGATGVLSAIEFLKDFIEFQSQAIEFLTEFIDFP